MAEISSYRSFGQSVDVSANKTLALTDAGIVQNIVADAITITLPATSAGATFIIRNGGVKATNGPAGSVSNETVLVTVSPAAADKIQGGVAGTATDDKDLLNTKATSRVGDYVQIVGDGTDGWIVQSIAGTWARQA